MHFADVNGDGRPDLVTVEQTVVRLYLNEGGKYGKPVFTDKVSDGMDVAFGDANGDGALDMFVLQGGNKGGRIFLDEDNGSKWKASVKLPAPAHGSGGRGRRDSQLQGFAPRRVHRQQRLRECGRAPPALGVLRRLTPPPLR